MMRSSPITCSRLLLVTEPTPFGLHDLKLAVDMVRELGLPFGVVVNRASEYTLGEVLADTELQPGRLYFEITESMLMGDVAKAEATLNSLRAAGGTFFLDDFGTGYSSLSYLKRLPIDRLKIDRSFIADIVTEPDDAAIAQTIIAMAHTLRLEVIAEGVETETQLALLRRWRCDAYQGYLCSRPMSADDMTRLLRTRRATREVSLAVA